MARLIEDDGFEVSIEPKNDKGFSYKELCAFIGTDKLAFDPSFGASPNEAWVVSDANQSQEPLYLGEVNVAAGRLTGLVICGSVVVLSQNEKLNYALWGRSQKT